MLSQAIYRMVMARLMTVVTIYIVAVALVVISGITAFDPLLLVFGGLLLLSQLFVLLLGYGTQKWGVRGLTGEIRLRDIGYWILMFFATLLIYGFLLL